MRIHPEAEFASLPPEEVNALLDKPRSCTLVHGAAQEWLKAIPNGKIDLTVTSPPYDELRKYGNQAPGAWTWESFTGMAVELERITVEGGIIVWVVGDETKNGSETGSSFRQALFFRDELKLRMETMIYSSEKPPGNKRRYEQKFEYMFVFSKGNHKTWNPIMEKSRWAGAVRNERRFRQGAKEGSGLAKVHTKGEIKELKLKGNIWHYDTGNQKSTLDKEAYKHPAIFPEALAKDHIISWSNPGDLVCDPMTGSGTVPKMCKATGRRFVGGDRELEFLQIIPVRLARLGWDVRDKDETGTPAAEDQPANSQGHLGL